MKQGLKQGLKGVTGVKVPVTVIELLPVLGFKVVVAPPMVAVRNTCTEPGPVTGTGVPAGNMACPTGNGVTRFKTVALPPLEGTKTM